MTVPDGALLRGYLLDGRPAYCTIEAAWFAIGEQRSICLFDPTRSGYFTGYYVLGTIRSATFDTHLPYTLSTPAQIAEAILRLANKQQTDHNAAIFCNYQGAVANATAPGNIFHQAFADVEVNAACREYYRQTGRLP